MFSGGKRGLRRWVGENLLKRGGAYAVLHGKRAPFIGRVAAQMCCVDVTHIPEIQAGDTANLPARRTLVSPDVPRRVTTGGGDGSTAKLRSGSSDGSGQA